MGFSCKAIDIRHRRTGTAFHPFALVLHGKKTFLYISLPRQNRCSIADMSAWIVLLPVVSDMGCRNAA
jgi:hypothetical protein